MVKFVNSEALAKELTRSSSVRERGRMRRVICVVIALVSFVGTGVLFSRAFAYKQAFDLDGQASGLQVPQLMMLIVAIVMAATGVLFASFAFSSNIYRVFHGKVIDREKKEAYTDPDSTTGGINIGGINVGGVPLGNGMSVGGTQVGGVTTGSTRVPGAYHPARYFLQLQRPEDDRTGWVEVSANTYNTVRNGSSLDLRRK